MTATERRPRVVADVRAWSGLQWAAVALLGSLAGIHVYLGFVAAHSPFFVAAGGFATLVAVFFTRFWAAILYVVGVGFVLALGVVWVLTGAQFLELGLFTGVLSLAFCAVGLYLFEADDSRHARFGE
ncbi:hypothetical protein NGM10_00690 [Halorussus salilacus]|uniref:hypothetical protein n=1 Tax=Halorussus salilacus TaxID=2953750 RepID=UPI00209D619A|nr:hypothetical protein [Halorussus salilacus]USZ68274.1 hypothetical protein NGM10_00690 [Halorussus salilacus]